MKFITVIQLILCFLWTGNFFGIWYGDYLSPVEQGLAAFCTAFLFGLSALAEMSKD